MQKLMKERLRELERRQRRRRQMRIIAAFFGVIVIGGVVWGMTRPGVAMTGDPTCGLEEHKHSDKCYEDVLVCEKEESEGHKHDDSCYKTEKVLVCGKEESEGTKEESEEGSEEDSQEVTEGHKHDESCYEEKKELVCEKEESKGHTHTDKCYKKELTCEKEEHTHDENCYIDKDADVEKKSDWDKQYKSTKWKDAWGEDLVTAADKQVGYKESTKNYKKVSGEQKGYTRYGDFSGEAYADWDAAFVNFCIHYAGISKSDVFPNTTDTNKWYNKFSKVNGSFLTAPDGYEPEKGDIVFFEKKKGETDFTMGIVSSSDNKKNIKVIEGNVDNQVKEEKYSTGDGQIFAYIKVTEIEHAYKGIESDDAEKEEEPSEEPKDTEKTEETEEPGKTEDAEATDAAEEAEGSEVTDAEETEGETEETSGSAFDSEYDGDGVIIHVKADAGIIPEGAELTVTPIEKKKITSDMSAEEKEEAEKVNQQYNMTSEKLNEESEKNEQELQGFLAYDISFMLDGQEIEPNGEVKVTMDFKEAVAPEGVSENAQVAVNHLKENGNGGVKVENLTETDTTNITTAEKDAAVEKVELVANEFSVFTITWYRDWELLINVKYVDTEGNILDNALVPDGEEIKLESNETINVKERFGINEELEDGTYARQKIKLVAVYPDGIQTLEDDVRTIQYVGGIDNELYVNETMVSDGYYGNRYPGLELHVVYKRQTKVTRVPTIDSSARIQMRMIDFNSTYRGDNGVHNPPIFVPFDEYRDDGSNERVYQGILKNQLSGNYPEFATPVTDTRAGANGGKLTSLKDLFENATPVNKLFLKSYYEGKGHYYHYDSQENAASLDDSGNFIVSEEKITPRVEGKGSDPDGETRRGNFLPYNKIGSKVEKAGEEDTEEDLSKENLYTPEGDPNFHFGLELSAEFMQMENGEYDGLPIEYQFTGDDDLWVYIDGILVLDMGGCHKAQSGSINFKTGEVKVSGKSPTTLKQIFKDALEKESLKDPRLADAYWDGDTFSAYSGHTFKMWYMERGASVSNLKLHFNLPTVRRDHVQLEKRLLDANGEEVNGKYSDEKFYFEIYAQKIKSSDKGVETYYDDQYEKLTSEGREIVDAETGETLPFENGILTLKPNQVAAIGNASGNRKIYFKEVNLPTDKYDKDRVTINAATDKDITIGTDGNIASIESDKKTVSERKRTIFTNYLKDENVKELEITKEFSSSAKPGQDEEEFEVAIEFRVGDKWIPYTGEYTVLDEKGEVVNPQNSVSDNEKEGGSEESVADDENAGKIKIRKDYIIKIPGMTKGMQYRVYETNWGTFESDPTYKKGDNSVTSEQINGDTISYTGITGTIGNDTERITIVNSNQEVEDVPKDISFQKIWDDYDNYFGKRPEKIWVTLAYKTDDGFVQVDKYKQELPNENGWNCQWKDVPSVVDGESREWTVMELDVDDQYYIRGENNTGLATVGIPSSDIIQYNSDDLKDPKPTDNKAVNAFSDDTSDTAPTDYYYIVNSLNPEAFDDWAMLKKSTSKSPDTDEPVLLDGATFEITEKGASEGKQTTTGEDGVIKWPEGMGKVDGEYHLSELSAPSGYRKSSKSWTILIKNGIPVIAAWPDGNMKDPGVVVDEQTGQIKFYFENTPVFSLPSTGGKGIYLYMFSGILLMAGGLLMTYKNRRRGVLRS